jgi:hypothetical protein
MSGKTQEARGEKEVPPRVERKRSSFVLAATRIGLSGEYLTALVEVSLVPLSENTATARTLL